MKLKIMTLDFNNKYTRAFAPFFAIISLLIITTFSAIALDVSTYAAESVLNSGNWVKVKVTETGVYKISQSDIAKWGFSDISKIHIFGYGGSPVTEILNDSFIDDLPQVPIFRSDNQIFFYAQSQETWSTYNSSGLKYRQEQHPYSEAGYYFVTDKEFPDMLIENKGVGLKGDVAEVTTFTDRLFYEKELYSPGQTGRFLLGEDFKYNSSQNFKFTLTDYVEGTEVNALTTFAAKIMNGSGTLSFQQNGTNLAKSASDGISAVTAQAYEHVKTAETVKSFIPNSNNLTYTVSLKNTGTLFTARLDYITINYTRRIHITGKELLFRGGNTSNTEMNFVVSGSSNKTHVWDVTNSSNPFDVAPTITGNMAKFTPANQGIREYVAFEPTSTFKAPEFVEKITNQNLHGLETPDMVILTPKEFTTEAERVAQLHRTEDNMKVLVINHKDIFNEFSSGTPDAMAYRKFLKMLWDRGNATGESAKLGYLLLFGRGSYDNRQITPVVKKSSYPMLLTWQTLIGDNENSSYNTDDVFGFMEDGSGSSFRLNTLNLAIGRMPVKSVAEAKTVVDKLYRYVTKADFGSWKNNVLVIADDADGAEHMKQSDKCIYSMKRYGGDRYVYNHLYTDAFNSISSGGRRAYPDARAKMFQKFNEGALWVNYIGHASPVGWTHEGLLNITDINNMYLNHYPLFYTATCEFTRWDSDNVLGGELMFLNGRGGAISLISTSRVVYISNNGILSGHIAGEVFKKDANGNYQRTGDILKNGKNAYGKDDNKLRFSLTGDPAMRLSYPTYTIKLETVNGQEVTKEEKPTIKARENVTITGSVYDISGEKATGFNGIINPTLYDAEVSVETNGNGDSEGKGGVKHVFYDRSNRLYIGQDSIKNGEFKLNISMPTEILNNYSPAMFSFYAYDENGIEANGGSENIYVYGYDESAKPDTEGPVIDYLVLNASSFKNGDTVNESPMLIASFHDESGINVSTSGIGHQMTVLIDDADLYSDGVQYYTPSSGDSKGGTVNYPLSNLSAGNHKLRFKVWDTANNSSESTIEFNVQPGMKPDLYEVYSTSNPASVQADFYLKHNRPDALIVVTISVYDLGGKEVWSHTETGKSDFFTSFPITWDLKDNAGRRVNRGIYVYRAGISTDGVQEATKSKKIAVAGE